MLSFVGRNEDDGLEVWSLILCPLYSSLTSLCTYLWKEVFVIKSYIKHMFVTVKCRSAYKGSHPLNKMSRAVSSRRSVSFIMQLSGFCVETSGS